MENTHDGHRERLRERYIKHGFDGLMEHELLELVLTYAIPRKNTNNIAHALIKRFGSLENVLNSSCAKLQTAPGIGENTAIFLNMLGNFILRSRSLDGGAQNEKRPRLATPAAAAAYALSLAGNEPYENIYVASLDKNLRLLHGEKLLSGSLTETPIYPRLIVESALMHNAHSVLLFHNHPSGDVQPSQNDIEATLIVKSALASIDIELYDHLIIGKDKAYSFERDIIIEIG